MTKKYEQNKKNINKQYEIYKNKEMWYDCQMPMDNYYQPEFKLCGYKNKETWK